MKDKKKGLNLENKKDTAILIITGKPKDIGYGHHTRMGLLRESLLEENISTEINYFHDSLTIKDQKTKIVLLDNRDSAFPDDILKRKVIKIAIDNRGFGRNQADFCWDVLPHFSMSHSEFLNSLKRILLPKSVSQIKPASKSAIIKKITSHKKDNSAQKLPHSSFIKHLKNTLEIECYYGQTFFEALYLGKKISLYDISPYHKKLSDWFIERWNQLPLNEREIDGSGLDRLKSFITSQL